MLSVLALGQTPYPVGSYGGTPYVRFAGDQRQNIEWQQTHWWWTEPESQCWWPTASSISSLIGWRDFITPVNYSTISNKAPVAALVRAEKEVTEPLDGRARLTLGTERLAGNKPVQASDMKERRETTPTHSSPADDGDKPTRKKRWSVRIVSPAMALWIWILMVIVRTCTPKSKGAE